MSCKELKRHQGKEKSGEGQTGDSRAKIEASNGVNITEAFNREDKSDSSDGKGKGAEFFDQERDQVDNDKSYDIKLMAVLLTTFESKEIITLQEPTKNAIQDIYNQRNAIAHNSETTLSNNKLDTIWITITEAIKQLGGTSLEQECYTLRNATLESSNTIIHQNIKDILGFIKVIESEYCQETTESQTEGVNEDNISPTEKENFVRLCILLNQIAPMAVRYCFKKNLFPERLDEMLMKLKGINANIDLECSIGHSGIKDEDNVDNYSLPLVLLLLKHCMNFRILDDELPDSSKTTIEADLTRINYYYRLIGDVKSPKSLTTKDFKDIWKIVAGVYMFVI